jgi:hypothetical protein
VRIAPAAETVQGPLARTPGPQRWPRLDLLRRSPYPLAVDSNRRHRRRRLTGDCRSALRQALSRLPWDASSFLSSRETVRILSVSFQGCTPPGCAGANGANADIPKPLNYLHRRHREHDAANGTNGVNLPGQLWVPDAGCPERSQRGLARS